MTLRDKVALVTGAGRGIGKGLAVRLARDGAAVAVNYPEDAAEAEEVVRAIVADGGRAVAVKADIADTVQRSAMFAQTLDAFGRLDVLVNNAAFDPGGVDFFSVDETLYDRVFAVNLKAAYFCCQEAARFMRRQGGGRIISISSVHGRMNFPNYGPYSVSKGGLDAMTRQMAVDLAPFGITVNAVAPGFIEVARTMAHFDPYSRDEVANRIPLRRVGFPRDVAALVSFLAGEEAGYVTGQVIACDGGTTTRMGF
jgi:NAD(P)-dependent dehydrogenase (short-subunit alcohol dehydrogenase family)